MIQINLLPDVKQEYLRARKVRNFAISVAILAGLASVAIVVLLLMALGVQKGREALADNAIKTEYESLSQIEDLSELVTLQNQLSLIGDQHDNKTMDSRLFSLLQAINPPAPNNIQFTTVSLDPEDTILTIEGVATQGYNAVETLTKTIRNTKFEFIRDQEVGSEDVATKVSIGETGFGENADGKRVLRFEVLITYNDILFSNEVDYKQISAPSRRIDVTDSRVGVPNSIFTAPVEATEEE